MAVTHQFVAARQEAFAGYAKDRAHEVGEVEVGYRYDLALRVADWPSTQPDVHGVGRRRHAYASLEHELPRRIERPQVRDEPGVGTFPLSAETTSRCGWPCPSIWSRARLVVKSRATMRPCT